MLKDFYKDTVNVSRATTTARKKTFAVVVTGMMAHIQAIQDTRTDSGIERKFNEFLMFTDDEVFIGDKITDQTSKKYEVIGVADMNFRVGHRHYESTMKAI